MRTWTFRYGPFYGIDLEIDCTWFLAFSLSSTILSRVFEGSLFLGMIAMLCIYLCIFLHEIGHVLIALRYGITTRCLLLSLFGWTAYGMKEPENPKQEIAIASAGPIVSILLAILFGLAFLVQIAISPTLAQHPQNDLFAMFILVMSLMNGIVAGFNLLPLYPMDGGRIFRAILLMMTKNALAAIRIAYALTASVGILGISWTVWNYLQTGSLSGWLRAGFALFLIIQSYAAYKFEYKKHLTTKEILPS